MPADFEDLGGEANPNTWYFAGDHGPLPNLVGHTFPIMTHNQDGVWSVIGTGFYISSGGLFVTARHVIEDILDSSRNQIAPIVIFHMHSRIGPGLFGPQEFLIRPISRCWVLDSADVAIGIAATCTNNDTHEILQNPSFPLSWDIPESGIPISTYAFPKHHLGLEGTIQTITFHPDLYTGSIQEFVSQNSMIPFPHIRVAMHIHGAASGGPAFSQAGKVIGINCTGGTGELIDRGTIVPIHSLNSFILPPNNTRFSDLYNYMV